MQDLIDCIYVAYYLILQNKILVITSLILFIIGYIVLHYIDFKIWCETGESYLRKNKKRSKRNKRK